VNCLEINDEYIQYIKEHPIESKKSALQMTMAIQNSELNAGGRYYTRTLAHPQIFSVRKTNEIFKPSLIRFMPFLRGS
jgi:hypothetical protein